MPDGNQRFSITPSGAVEDKDLSDAVFRTLACLGIFGDKNGWCWPGLKILSEMRGVSKPRISQDVKILAEKHYLQVRKRFEGRSQKSNLYRIIFDTPLTPEVTPPLTPEVNPPLTPEVNQNAPINAPINTPEDLPRKERAVPPPSLHPLALAIADVCLMDLAINRGRLFREAKLLAGATNPPATPELVRTHYNGNADAFWQAQDWRGKKGQRPTPSAIRETWGQWGVSLAPALETEEQVHAEYLRMNPCKARAQEACQ